MAAIPSQPAYPDDRNRRVLPVSKVTYFTMTRFNTGISVQDCSYQKHRKNQPIGATRLGPDRDFHYSIGPLLEELVCFHDVFERKCMGE